ncbi:two-component sensor histidine kinase [Bacteroidales bacterium]|nr:two-component sensor histidine kinase [Bacteroidales bacterium]
MSQLADEEQKKIEIWAEAVKLMATQIPETGMDPNVFNDYDKLIIHFTTDNTTIPLILTDDQDNILQYMNINPPKEGQNEYLQKKIDYFRQAHLPLELKLDETASQFVYYDDSSLLKQLQLFPYIQLGVVSIFILISFLALNSSKKAEQNRIWVGLSKETAHQLGTPISSLVAWMEYLKTKEIDPSFLSEMDKDIHRLQTIADRFSKIGSKPRPEPMDLNEVVRTAVDYMSSRISSKVSIECNFADKPISTMMNESLFSWVIENIIKNGVDSMDGKGKMSFVIAETEKRIKIDISDTGKGIAKSNFDAIFQPGYTTKQRGWGLGLSLVRRIIESYQEGKIYVLKSEFNKGTTFRIELKKH